MSFQDILDSRTNQWQVLEERVGGVVPNSSSSSSSGDESANHVDRQFVWGLRYIDDLVLRDRDADEAALTGDFGMAQSSLEERLYAMQDPNWNVTAIADPTGVVQERYGYDAYGNVVFMTPFHLLRLASSFFWVYTYTCRLRDAETELYDYRNRHYHLGCFHSRDPLSLTVGDHTLYRYVGNRPLLLTDPLGLQSYPPGTATCARTPRNGVRFVPNRGRFSQATLGPYDSEGDFIERFGSSFELFWDWHTRNFVDKNGCCCCANIGFVQTVAMNYSYHPGSQGYINAPREWQVDGGIPYPHSETKNPCTGSGKRSIQLVDRPNAPYFMRGVLLTLTFLRQRFETCVVCLDKGVTSKTTGLTVYGCLTWEHEIVNDAQNHYVYTRTIGSTTKTGNAGIKVQVSNAPGAAPSQDWINAVLAK